MHSRDSARRIVAHGMSYLLKLDHGMGGIVLDRRARRDRLTGAPLVAQEWSA